MNQINIFWKEFKNSVMKYPDKIAIEEADSKSITYKNLDDLSDRVAVFIQDNNEKFSDYICISSKKQ
ncbi:hypothetical protein [Clostridium sp.]|uniref:hypothetical protein n=1 Tax=Clostridium sp. TaxID=1506 RepID=UPI003D6CFBBE